MSALWAPWGRVLSIAVGGVAAALLLLGAGAVAERSVLGRDEQASRRKVQDEVRTSFDRIARDLRDTAARVADPAIVAAAAMDDALAARTLFDAAEVAARSAGDEALAITIYNTDNVPLAWSGRPSDLPADRLRADEAWFFTQGALGLRLVYLAPLNEPDGRRIGSVAVERSLGQAAALERDEGDAFVYPTRFGQVDLELAFESGRTEPQASAFDVLTPTGGRLVTATISSTDLARSRSRWRRAVSSLALVVTALAVLLMCGPLLDWRHAARSGRVYVTATLLTVCAIVAARSLLRLASLADWASGAVFSASGYASPLLAPLLISPFDFLVTALAAGGIVATCLFGVEAWRVGFRRRRIEVASPVTWAAWIVTQLIAGALGAALLVAYCAFVADTIANATVDLLHFSLHPWNTSRIAMQVGLLIWHATVLGAVVTLLRAAGVPWRMRRHTPRALLLTATLWLAPLAVWLLATREAAARDAPLWAAVAAAVVLAATGTRLAARYRHGSQAFRLIMLTLGLVVPALAFYPVIFQLARQSKIELVESRYGPQALNQRQTIQQLLEQSLHDIDAFPGLPDLVEVKAAPPDMEALTDRAFQVWRVTALATYPVTSSVELYGDQGELVSRFAFNLPEDLTTVPRLDERSCTWEVFEEVSPFFAEERRVLHAGRAVCVRKPDGTDRIVGSIVVHTMLDYANLPFVASQNPYLELLRPANSKRDESLSGQDIDYAVYGWSRTPIYSSDSTAWELDDATFERAAESRTPFWAQLQRGDTRFDTYLTNDRFGIYVMGFPVVAPLGHLVNLAELTVLAAGTYVVLIALNIVFGWFSQRRTSARALLQEVRASFYRKLFLAFVAAASVPVVALAILTRNYVANEMNDAVEQESVRTAAAARRVVEDLVAPRAAAEGAGIDDNMMVWVSRLISQDVNIFRGPRLLATSERNLFASGLLPTRTPATVYRGLTLRNEAATVSRERLGTSEYLVAGTPVRSRQGNTILTVPLTARQQEIEEQIDLLNRQVLLGALLFILAGAGLGYSLAERIADPVKRLTRATRRIANGELDVRVAATSSDELKRLVDDFNGMANELQRQRQALERTHRLEAWAEMSRQVAHDIKNPLTPIQLNAEHLRRVHADRHEPLGPVLDECVSNILAQVTLLRQIASEFSTFASSPTVKASAVDIGALLLEIVGPYRTALGERIVFNVSVDDLATVHVDRALVTRALTNVVENALHAMPGGGTLTLQAQADGRMVRIRVSDTGSGMDKEALVRAFEPYFSTKASGTGLGLPIAKRNVELNGGEIGITTGPGGTTVEVSLPIG